MVEDNLGLLVQEECTEDERKLFKLDSILTAIGLQGEEAVFDVLKQHERNPSKVQNLFTLDQPSYLVTLYNKSTS